MTAVWLVAYNVAASGLPQSRSSLRCGNHVFPEAGEIAVKLVGRGFPAHDPFVPIVRIENHDRVPACAPQQRAFALRFRAHCAPDNIYLPMALLEGGDLRP